jgi:hypothetical protein
MPITQSENKEHHEKRVRAVLVADSNRKHLNNPVAPRSILGSHKCVDRMNPQTNMFKKSSKQSEATDSDPNHSCQNNKRDRTQDFDDNEDDEDQDVSANDFAKMSRSERKRHREKKRRNDVNKGLDELMNLLLEIDPNLRKDTEEYRVRRGKSKAGGGAAGAHDDNLLSRVDLISHAVEVLRRVHRENEERKKVITALRLNLSQSRAASTGIAGGLPVSSLSSDLLGYGGNNQVRLTNTLCSL